MANEVKMAYTTGCSLVFTAFEPDGNGRGLVYQPLPEVRPTGYYRATPSTALEIGDVVLVYIQENVEWEDETVYCETEGEVYCDGERVFCENNWVGCFDETVNNPVFWIGSPIGEGEYESAIDISNVLNSLVSAQTQVLNVYKQEPEEVTMQVRIG